MLVKDMSIGIIGLGAVGSALFRFLKGKVKALRVHDIDWRKMDSLDYNGTVHGVYSALGCDLCFVCLPTPQKAGCLELDTSALQDFFNSIPPTHWKAQIVLKSTVPVGYTASLSPLFVNLVHSPEFLTAKYADDDTEHPRVTMIGIPYYRGTKDLTGTGSLLEDLYCQLYMSRYGTPCLVYNSDTTELIKLAMNGFFAVKVTFWNEVYRLCQGHNVDYRHVIEGITEDNRVTVEHTEVPGPDGKFGYGGACLPKDLGALLQSMLDKEVLCAVTEAAHHSNSQHRMEDNK